MSKSAVAFDFDGVIHKFRDGWRDGSIYDEPNENVVEAIYELNKMKIPVFIFSTRDPSSIVSWWNEQEFKIKAKVVPSDEFFFNNLDYIGVTQRKLPAQLYIDDRAFTYSGQDKKGIILAVIGKNYA